jgi:hypothetical protein
MLYIAGKGLEAYLVQLSVRLFTPRPLPFRRPAMTRGSLNTPPSPSQSTESELGSSHRCLALAGSRFFHAFGGVVRLIIKATRDGEDEEA